MAKGSEGSRSFLRLLFWEGMALAGFLHTRLSPIANPIWNLNFFYGALFFLVAYPILYVYRWRVTEGCLATILWPLSFVLSGALGVSCYLWLAYILLFTQSPYYYSMTNHWAVLGALFAFIYFPLVEPVLGVSKKYQSLGGLFWVFLYSALGGFFGFLSGRFVDQKFGVSIGLDNRRFLLWLALILLGTALGAMIGQKRGK